VKNGEKIIRALASYAFAPAAVSLVAWVLVITVYVIGRRFGQGWMFVEEYTGYWLVFISFMALADCLLTDGHIQIDTVTRLLSKRVRDLLQVCSESIGLVIVVYLIVRSAQWFIEAVQFGLRSGSSTNTLVWPTTLAVPIGLLLLGLALIVKLRNSIKSLMPKKRES
jgi:C4-dicarboxylate transporter DctQ subunit